MVSYLLSHDLCFRCTKSELLSGKNLQALQTSQIKNFPAWAKRVYDVGQNASLDRFLVLRDFNKLLRFENNDVFCFRSRKLDYLNAVDLLFNSKMEGVDESMNGSMYPYSKYLVLMRVDGLHCNGMLTVDYNATIEHEVEAVKRLSKEEKVLVTQTFGKTTVVWTEKIDQN